MANDKYYFILNGMDPYLRRIGTLSVDGATQYTADSIQMQIADADNTMSQVDDDVTSVDTVNPHTNMNQPNKNWVHSGTITVPEGQPDSDKFVNGNCIAYHRSLSAKKMYEYYVMKIYMTDEEHDASGRVLKTAHLLNLFQYDLAMRIPPKKSFKDAQLKDIFAWMVQNTDWEIINLSKSVKMGTVEFDGKQKSSKMLQTVLQAFDVEIDAFVRFWSNGMEKQKVVVITDRLAQGDIYREVVASNNLTSAKRTGYYPAMTKLYPYGSNGCDLSKAKNSGGNTWIVDEAANRKYNPLWKKGYYNEFSVTSQIISDPDMLYKWAQIVLKYYNHPRYFYEIGTTPDFDPPLGAKIQVKDTFMDPIMTVEARVISKTQSFSNPYGNTVQFGEFVTINAVTPSWLRNFEENLMKMLDRAREHPETIQPRFLTPDGRAFSNRNQSKRLIMQAWEGGANISGFIDPYGYVIKKLNPNGTYDDTFKMSGYLNNIKYVDTEKLRGYIESQYIMDDSEIKPNQDGTWKLGEFVPTDPKGKRRAAQYIVKLSDGTYITSHDLKGDSPSGGGKDTMYCHRDKSFKEIDHMIVTNGGHGATFGAKQSGSTIIIYTSVLTSGGCNVVTFNYKKGTISASGSEVSVWAFVPQYARVNYDPSSDMVGYMCLDGTYKLFNDVSSINDDMPLYQFNIHNYGFNMKTQTYQANCLYFPWVFWHSGQYKGTDMRKVYGVNIVHGGSVFEQQYNFSTTKMNSGAAMHEPEALSLVKNGSDYNLLVSFNETMGDGSAETERVYQMPFKKRLNRTSPIDNGSLPDDYTDTDFGGDI